jgi:hypothetical protein
MKILSVLPQYSFSILSVSIQYVISIKPVSGAVNSVVPSFLTETTWKQKRSSGPPWWIGNNIEV